MDLNASERKYKTLSIHATKAKVNRPDNQPHDITIQTSIICDCCVVNFEMVSLEDNL